MKYGPMTLDYVIEGAKNQKEIDWAKEVTLNIYNKMAGESSRWTEGFNTMLDYIKMLGFKIDISEDLRITNMDPTDEVLYDKFCRGVYRAFSKENGGVRDGRIIELDGINALKIKSDFSKATLYCSIKDYNKD